MSESTDASATPAAPQPFMSCSECQAPMREKYYALNERPICLKCRPKYARLIANSEGTKAFWTTAFHGALVAVAGALVLAAIVSVFPAAKIFVLIPIGYLIGKRIMKRLDHYSARRYQYLAVTLTYLAFLTGMGVPALRQSEVDAKRREEVRVKMQGTVATQGDDINKEMSALLADSSDEFDEDSLATDSADAEEEAEPPVAAPAPPSAGGPSTSGMILAILLLPLLSMLGFGMAFSAVGVLSLGYAFFQAWKQTDDGGRDFSLQGPFKVGAGPIAARL